MSEIERYDAPAKTPAEVTTADTDSWIGVMGDVVRLAAHIAPTEFVPKGLRGKPEATAAAILYGREVGLPPMTALSQTHVIEGKPAMSSEAMRALILAAGHELVVTESTGAVCTMRGRRRGSEHWTTVTWTLDMARAAGVAGKQVWKAYPRQMLQARATAELARLVFPDVIHGFMAVEEFDTDPGADAAGEPTRSTSKVQRGRKTPAPAPAVAVEAPPLPDEEPQTPEPQRTEAAELGTPDEEAAPASSTTPDPEPAGKPAPSGAGSGSGVTGPPSTQAQRRMLFAQLKGLDVDLDDDQERRHIVGQLLGRPLESFTDLSRDDASAVVDTLARFRTKAELWAFLDGLEQDALPLDEPVDVEIVEDAQ